MPLLNYTTDADWDLAYGPTAPRVPSRAEYTDYEWRQDNPDLGGPAVWGPIETRYESPTGTTWRRQKRLSFSGDPLAWQVNFYGREDLPEYYYERRNRILLEHAIALSDRILILGAGTGALVKAFADVGYTNVFGLEPSNWIQGNNLHMWGGVVLVDASITGGNQLMARLRQATGDDVFDWIIDEEMSIGYTDAELVNIEINPATRWIDLPERLLGTGVPQTHIVHLVRTTGDPTIVNIHTMVEWEAFDPAHSWMEVF